MSDLPEEKWRIFDLNSLAEDEFDEGHHSYPRTVEFLAAATQLVKECWTSADAHYLRGHAIYLLWAKGLAPATEALTEMDLALKLDPGHQWARFDSIVLAYRLGMYGKVIEVFADLDRPFFRSENKDWRYLVAWDYFLSATYRVGLAEGFRRGVEDLMAEIIATDDDPDSMAERPGSLPGLYRDINHTDEGAGDAAFLGEQLARLVPGSWLDEGDLANKPSSLPGAAPAQSED